jgi:hypothetical protein
MRRNHSTAHALNENAAPRASAFGADCPFKAANLLLRRVLDEVSQDPMDKPSFLLFVRAVLLGDPPKPRVAAAREVGVRVLRYPLAAGALIVQNGHACR